MPWTRKAYELLADGKWHDREELIRALEDLVPPGRAMRATEKSRMSANSTKGGAAPPVRYVQRSPEYLQRVGARLILKQALRRFEVDRRDGQVFYRRRDREPTTKDEHS